MMRTLGKNKLCQLAVVAVASIAVAQSDAMAWSYGSWGSSGSYGSYGSGGSYGSYGSGGSYGSYGGGHFGRHRARRAARRAARASYGSYGSYSSYGSYASYGSTGSYGSSGSYSSCGSYGGVSYGTPVEVEVTAPMEGEVPIEVPAEPVPADTSAAIEVTLPADAKVFVNDAATTSTGGFRSYVSNGLQKGRSYSYRLRVEFEQDGQAQVESKVVTLNSGEKVELSFGQESQEQVAATDEPVKTALHVQVPEGAQVFLAGAPTKQAGEQRSFVTQRLAAGEVWDGYLVRVELEQEGQTLVDERNIKLEGGQTYELAFDFNDSEAPKIAQLGR